MHVTILNRRGFVERISGGRASAFHNPVLPLYPALDGCKTVPGTPGLFLDPDPELVKQYQTEN